MTTDASISPWRQLPHPKYIPSLYPFFAATAVGVATSVPGLAALVDVEGAGDSAGESVDFGGDFRATTGGRLLFFLTAGAAEREAGGAALFTGFAAVGGGADTTAMYVEALCCGVCESNRCAAELVR